MDECDLIMKGGITSGVVYPQAIAEIAKSHRLRSIGGTSAGAIAAVLAAAAEFRRQTSPDGQSREGFDAVGALAADLAGSMGVLLQPAPEMQPLFEILMAHVAAPKGGRLGAVIGAIARVHVGRIAVGGVVAALGIAVALATGDVWAALFGLLAGMVVAGGLIAAALLRDVFERLPRNDFGLCPGLRQGDGGPGLTDWICDAVDRIAGNLENGDPGAPLTIGRLRQHGIELAAMTTDLSSRRPYQLPLMAKTHYFSKAEFDRLFPARVVAALIAGQTVLDVSGTDRPTDLYPLPTGDAFPVCLVARLSLSFPGLIRAVPLYRFDDGLVTSANAKDKIRRCLFSDGGISSNFPIHFFDALLPTRPTFGISLADYDPARHRSERIDLPEGPRNGRNVAVRPIDTVFDFVGSIVDTAKDWQDTLQSLLPGYSERIVEIRLDPAKEGGLNLAMDRQTIEALTGHGLAAGRAFAGFDFDEHRWRRAITVLPRLEAALVTIAESIDAVPPAGCRPYPEVLATRPPKAYATQPAGWRVNVLAPFAEWLAAEGRAVTIRKSAQTRSTVQEGNLPWIDADIRLVANADRRPR